MAKQWAKSFYRSQAWQYCRQEVLRRDSFTCQDCGARALDVHHMILLTPDNINDRLVALNPDKLVSLCGDCHKARHDNTADTKHGLVFGADGQVVPVG